MFVKFCSQSFRDEVPMVHEATTPETKKKKNVNK